jgi:hypothetical protein
LNYKDLAWEILYDEIPEEIPDPNKPENTALINAKRAEEREKLKRFMQGAGAPLIERWKTRIRADNLALLINPEADNCNCISCLMVREIKTVFKLLIEAEEVLKEKKHG